MNDTSYSENLNIIITNPNSQDASVSLTSPSQLFTNQTTTVSAQSTKVVCLKQGCTEWDFEIFGTRNDGTENVLQFSERNGIFRTALV